MFLVHYSLLIVATLEALKQINGFGDKKVEKYGKEITGIIRTFFETKNNMGVHTACKFAFHLEKELFSLQNELATGAYMPGEYRYMAIETPKKRTIAIASFRDRVVHHALVNVLEGIYEKTVNSE